MQKLKDIFSRKKVPPEWKKHKLGGKYKILANPNHTAGVAKVGKAPLMTGTSIPIQETHKINEVQTVFRAEDGRETLFSTSMFETISKAMPLGKWSLLKTLDGPELPLATCTDGKWIFYLAPLIERKRFDV